MSSRAKERGMALAIVLGGLVILSMISIALLSHAGRDVSRGSTVLDRARAEALVEGAVDSSIVALFAPDTRRRLVMNEGIHVIEIAGTEITARIRDSCGLWDINQGDMAVFVNLLSRLGVTDVDLIAGSLTAARQVEAGLLSREQLRALPGLDHELYARLGGEVTVNCRADRIDPEFASPLLLSSVPGLTDRQAAAIVDQRRVGPIDADLLASAAAHIAPGPGQTYEITASHGFGPGTLVFRRAEVTLTYNPAEPYRVVDWDIGQ